MSLAIYPGSFDPITNGHVDIIRRLSPLYKKLIIVVANSPEKNYLFSGEERAALASEALAGVSGIEVVTFNGLTVDYAEKVGAQVIVRGIRAVSDLENEMTMANMNRKLNERVETLIAFPRPEFSFISSRLVKEVAKFNGALDQLVPDNVIAALKDKMLKKEL